MPLWPLVAYFVVVLVLVGGMLLVSFLLGERRYRGSQEPYESGMLPTGSARLRFPAEFYLIAMFFVIFDLESVFIIAWAIAMRELRWAGYAEMLIFVGVLVAALIYLWRSRALDWGTSAMGYRRRESTDYADLHR